mmetsp:Transcript_63987/g.181728  ORF Transcript_63987/g.181728 Transcript_63987/m.181728 type:complete len:237 (-) Transcript_63987:475-1185(-)
MAWASAHSTRCSDASESALGSAPKASSQRAEPTWLPAAAAMSGVQPLASRCPEAAFTLSQSWARPSSSLTTARCQSEAQSSALQASQLAPRRMHASAPQTSPRAAAANISSSSAICRTSRSRCLAGSTSEASTPACTAASINPCSFIAWLMPLTQLSSFRSFSLCRPFSNHSRRSRRGAYLFGFTPRRIAASITPRASSGSSSFSAAFTCDSKSRKARSRTGASMPVPTSSSSAMK